MKKPILLFAAIAAITFAAGPSLTFAMGDGGSGGANPASSCKKGEVWDKKKKHCVKASSGVIPDEDLYEQGRALAQSGHYDWALQVLAAVSNQNDPRVLNYTGYSYRKSGRFEIGMEYYKKALAINPDFVLAREYLGEGYVATGHVDLAKLQLNEIEKRCGTACEEYGELAEHIASAVN